MATASTALNSLLDPFSRCLDAESAQRIADFRVGPSVPARVDILAERSSDGLLSDDGRSEYESLVNAADVISILKLKAGRFLQSDFR